jgi:lipopolysaccharide/colanic/teichoic acid biosynthesis glycosyltransferase
MLGVAALVKATSKGPVFYIQERVGRFGVPFRLFKFRSMQVGSDRSGALVTGGGDPRVTPVGRWLRRSKLDELPQLWNVARGEMSLVGPRPEVPRYVAHYTPSQRRVLEVRPGLTDPATLAFRDEETRLAAVPLSNRETFYLKEILPRKLEINLAHLDQGIGSDLRVLWRTLAALLGTGS